MSLLRALLQQIAHCALMPGFAAARGKAFLREGRRDLRQAAPLGAQGLHARQGGVARGAGVRACRRGSCPGWSRHGYPRAAGHVEQALVLLLHVRQHL